MDPDVDELVRQERLHEAATTASARGDPRLASHLFERACEWSAAARESLRAGDGARALEMAAEAGDDELADAAVDLVPSEARESVAARLVARGRDRWAATLLERAGRATEAARLWERCGRWTHAAGLLEKAGDAAGAARVLESALRRTPDSWDVATALGALFARFGKHAAAVRVLQHVPPNAAERREALVHLASSLERLGLQRAAQDAASELTALGGATPGSTRRPWPEVHAHLFGRYEVVHEVASSASARVLECVDVVRGERVAVKVFAAWDTRGAGRDALARFEREVRTMRALDHPSIVPYRDYVAEGPAIVLAWMAGGTLERMLAGTGALAPARAVEIASGLLAALGEAHRVGILHRDVKPANVLFDDAGGARLSDFGVAHLGDVSTTATAAVFGTLAYMSPEQREGRPATARSDVFSVGTMLREMITGERPSPGDPPRRAPSDAHGELGEAHDAIVARLTAQDPQQRPADAFEARALLATVAWPVTIDAFAAAGQPESRSSVHPEGARLEVAPSGGFADRWTGRRIGLLPATPTALARARAFAELDHPGLQTVLRVDAAGSVLWVDADAGRPLARKLSPGERTHLASALHALHARGLVHGRVDASHVVVGESGVVLLFTDAPDGASSSEGDDGALSRL
jgi:serine/threonine-protein kinase